MAFAAPESESHDDASVVSTSKIILFLWRNKFSPALQKTQVRHRNFSSSFKNKSNGHARKSADDDLKPNKNEVEKLLERRSVRARASVKGGRRCHQAKQNNFMETV